MRLLLLPLAAALALGACRIERVGPGEDATRQRAGSVSAAIVGDAVRITNGTAGPVAHHVWPRGYLALFAPCADPGPSCVTLAAGASVTIPIAEIEGVAPTTEAITVRWWRVAPDESGVPRASAVTEIDLEL